MSSVSCEFKHAAQDGYFLTTTTGVVGYYISTAGSGSGGSYVQPVMTPLVGGVEATRLALQGVVLRDLGKTVTVGGISATANTASTNVTGTVGVPTRVFRKVQIINGPGTVGVATNVANGVTGSATDATTAGMYQSIYIELPTLGRSGAGGNTLAQQVVYVPALPGLYV